MAVEALVDKSMRARQLASTVRQGRRVTFSILDEDQITGYLCGWDNDTYMVILPNPKDDYLEPIKLLIPKSNILFIELHDDRTFREEPAHEKMVEIVQRFKSFIDANYFN